MTHSTRGDKSICLPGASEAEYKTIINDNNTFREYILQVLAQYPEIFPLEMKKGFSFHDWVISSKQQLPMRRIKLKENEKVYQLRPDFVMPYMIGKTDEMEKPLYLCQFGVPFEAIAYVFGRNAMYWYRAYCALSRASQFKVAYRFPSSHRTSNMLDRLMNHQDRLLFNMRYFHGNKESAKQYLRSMALIWNFHH